MKLIETQSELADILRAKKAIIFIAFEWSGQAKLSEQVITAWRGSWQTFHSDLHIPFFKLEPDNNPDMSKWVQDEVRERSGYGSLVWIKDAEIADYEPYVVGAGLRDIARRTEALFRN